MTDKDRIRVAKVGERYITRGDLFKIIREMPDNVRPMIRTEAILYAFSTSILTTASKENWAYSLPKKEELL
jgi:arsenate reductase-like glutaredoxin family protein